MKRLITLAAVLVGGPLATAGPITLPNGDRIETVNFERHIVPLLSRLGCNAGACHGSFQGKGGFTLSLFGHDPDIDYVAIARDGLGRRVNRSNPDLSLLLQKPTAGVAHGGGKRFAKNSWQYSVFREWITQGCSRDAGTGAIGRLDVRPAEHRFGGPDDSALLSVKVTYRDGTSHDVTPFCDFRIKDDTVAEVASSGRARALRPGDTPVIISYRGHLAASRLLVPNPSPGKGVAAMPAAYGPLDAEVFAKLRQLNIEPSDLAGDSEFLRRATLDTIGSLPTPAEVRAFRADANPAKRQHKIEELLHHPLHAALWATKLCDITGANVDEMDGPPDLRGKRARMWHDWLRRRVAENMPYDQIVHGILCATSREGRPIESWIQDEIGIDVAARAGQPTSYASRATLDLFWRRMGAEDFFPVESMAERTAAAFLGVRLECAQCHKHPYDRWTQTDYRAFANIFSQVQFGNSPEVIAAADRLLARRRAQPPEKRGPPIPRLVEIFLDPTGPRRLPDPKTHGELPARALGGPDIDPRSDPREQLFAWLTGDGRSQFARAFVNRVWAMYFGAGLIDPVDNISVANPAVNERLLALLTEQFIASGYDLRELERAILNSRTYQTSATPNARNGQDKLNFSHTQPRRLMAEVTLDVLNDALGTSEDFGADAPRGARAIEIASNRATTEYARRLFRVFGRPARTATCDCERATEPAVPQSLFLMSDPAVLEKIRNGRLQKLLKQSTSDSEVIDELFLATLSRFPVHRESAAALGRVKQGSDRKEAFTEILWALINTREFCLNH
jgi:hypothetical protein